MPDGLHISVLGGGPAGLATAAAARQRGLETTVFEAAERIGGTCITHEVNGFRFDSGAHRVHDKDPEVTAWLSEQLGEDLHEVCAPSRIWDDGRWLDFPINGIGLVRHLGLLKSAAAAADLVAQRIRGRGAPRSFLDFALAAYGRPVADRFLLNYSEKLWGAEPSRLSTEIAGSRLSGLDLRSFIADTLLGNRMGERHVEGRFVYPRGGIEAVPATLAAACGRENIRTSSPVLTLEHDDRRITALRTDTGGPVAVDQVVSSLPLGVVARILEPAPPAAVLAAVERIRFRQVILVAIFLDRPSLTDSATIYFPEPSFEFTRLCEPRNRCRTMAPDGRTSVVAEIPCSIDDVVWSASEDELSQIVCRRLIGAGLIREAEILGSAVRRMRDAYPVLETGIDDAVDEIHQHLGGFSNLRLVGRCGTFTYGWIHNMIRDGWTVVDDLQAER